MKKIRELFRNTKLNIKFTSIIILFMVIPIGVLAGVLFYVMEHFTVLDDDWDIEEKAVAALHEWGLPGVPLSHPMHLLSGGEKTKVFLAGIALHSPSFILMDEPTNHLDDVSRGKLYRFITSTSSGMLVVSHDRILLNLLSSTYELT